MREILVFFKTNKGIIISDDREKDTWYDIYIFLKNPIKLTTKQYDIFN